MNAENEFLSISSKKRVFIASPYTKPDPCINVNISSKVLSDLLDDGKCIPVTMLWTHFFHSIHPRSYESWLFYCMSFIPICDAMLVLPGESSGKDREVEIAKSLGKPIFYSKEELYSWIDGIVK